MIFFFINKDHEGDRVSAMACGDLAGDRTFQLLVGSEDREIRVLRGEEVHIL